MNLEILRKYGFDKFYENRISDDSAHEAGMTIVRVSSVQKDRFTVLGEHGEKGAVLKGSEFYGRGDAVFPAVGDFVVAKDNPAGDDVIYAVLERKSKFSRLDSFNQVEQVVAADFDYVFIMMSANKDFNKGRLERYLTAAWQSGGVPVVVITKADLCADVDGLVVQAECTAPMVDVVAVSSLSGFGFERLKSYLSPGKTAVLLGSSGVGKSSLVNALAGREVMKVNDIREADSKGRHTTTYRQLIVLNNGSMVIDTPGMRELGMWDVSEGIESSFADIEELTANCHFSDCNHDKEPGCAVREALLNGRLSEKRWLSYIKLKKESEFAKRKEAARLAKAGKTLKKVRRNQASGVRHGETREL